MRISPTLLLLMMLIFVFMPSIEGWINQPGSAWYRPFIVWLITIAFLYGAQRRSHHNEL